MNSSATAYSQRWFTCPECGKRTWPSKKAAKAAIRRTTEGRAAHRVYGACDGVGYHTGHNRSTREAKRLQRGIQVCDVVPGAES